MIKLQKNIPKFLLHQSMGFYCFNYCDLIYNLLIFLIYVFIYQINKVSNGGSGNSENQGDLSDFRTHEGLLVRIWVAYSSCRWILSPAPVIGLDPLQEARYDL